MMYCGGNDALRWQKCNLKKLTACEPTKDTAFIFSSSQMKLTISCKMQKEGNISKHIYCHIQEFILYKTSFKKTICAYERQKGTDQKGGKKEERKIDLRAKNVEHENCN